MTFANFWLAETVGSAGSWRDVRSPGSSWLCSRSRISPGCTTRAESSPTISYLIPFASDGASEYFYVDHSTGSILMIPTTGTRDNAAHCGGSVTEFLSRLTAGWDPFEQLTD